MKMSLYIYVCILPPSIPDRADSLDHVREGGSQEVFQLRPATARVREPPVQLRADHLDEARNKCEESEGQGRNKVSA
jgi:hypothetical protein